MVNDNISLWTYEVGTDLSKRKLTRCEKLYLGEQISTCVQSIRSLSESYQLNKRTLSDYKRLYNLKVTIYEQKGRPRCFDEETQSKIVGKLMKEPHMPEAKLRELIRKCHKELWASSNINLPKTRHYRKISIRSVVRYSRRVRKNVVSSISCSTNEEVTIQQRSSTMEVKVDNTKTKSPSCCIN